jgi:uncharacterized protein YndB with AHSA1/START domain
MDFEYSVHIRRPPEVCFAFLRDKDSYPQETGSPVLRLDKTTPGPADVGTRYLEVVQMFPFVRGTIHSVITRFEPPRWLAEDFTGAGMAGQLAYEFVPEAGGTRLIQREQMQMTGLLRPLQALVERLLIPQLKQRLEDIKTILEGGWEGNVED